VTYFLHDDDEDSPKKVECESINWKENKNITITIVSKTQKNKKSGAKRVVQKETENPSFFNFFKSIDIENSDLEEKELEKLEERMNINYDIARTLVDEVIPYSLEYYLGVKHDDEIDDDDD